MTTIREIVDDSNLVTDACPHPPKNENVIIEEPHNDEKTPISPTHTSIPRNYNKYPKKTKQKTKSTSSPIANIINIANSNGIQIGKNITYNIQKMPSKFDNKERNFEKTESVTKLLESNNTVTREHIMFVSSHVGKGWRDIGRLLNYSEGQIYQIEETHISKGIKEVVYQLLLDWIQNEPDKGIIRNLTEVLWESRQEEVVMMFSKKFPL